MSLSGNLISDNSNWRFKLKKQALRKPSRTITPRQKRVFGFITLLIPVLFFVIIEISLRLFHYGPDLSVFTIETIGGKEYYTLNPLVKNRYFSQVNFSPDPSPEYFLVSKPRDTFRIFCLGGSTTVGYPYWYNGAFSSFLRDRLRTLFPDRSIELVNLGMTATNSYTVLDLSKDLIKLKPDLLIVYDGHNEFYGALGVASKARIANARWMTLLYLRMVHLRTFQLAKNVLSDLRGLMGKTPLDYSNRGTLMEQVAGGQNVPYKSDMYIQAHTIFRQNLAELAKLCRIHHIPLILGTQVSNLREQFPFISNHSPGISRQQRSQFQQLYKNGLELQSKCLQDSAIVFYRSAISLDSLYADAHYRLAQCLDAKGEKQEASSEYILARDYDELRFRTDSKFNNLIRSMADHQNCFVADIETVFKALSQDSLIGNNLILEHLHPNARGHFLIAKEYARRMREQGLLVTSEEWNKREKASDDSLWEQRHLTDIDEVMAARKIELLTSGWPFKNQSQNLAPIPATDTLRFIAEQAIHNRIGWVTVHEHAAEYYLRRHDSTNAEKEYKTIINQLPHNVAPYLKLAYLYFNQEEFSKAETVLLASLQVEQTSVAFRALGDVYLKQGKAGNAIRYYQELGRFPEDPAAAPENAYMLALAYLISEKPAPAIRILEQTVSRYPSYKPARELLSRVRQVEKANPGH
jgi:tetratricopeptide (TPR) repeat protein